MTKNGIERMKTNSSLLTLLMVLLVGCANATVGTTEKRFDFRSQTPAEFVDFLKQEGELASGSRRIRVDEQMVGWITEEDIPGLLARLDSVDPCMSLYMGTSSYLPDKTTVGDIAAYLIDGFRNRVFPQSLYSVPYTNSQKKELRRWWLQYQEAIRINR